MQLAASDAPERVCNPCKSILHAVGDESDPLADENITGCTIGPPLFFCVFFLLSLLENNDVRCAYALMAPCTTKKKVAVLVVPNTGVCSLGLVP